VPQLRRLVAAFPPRQPGFDPRSSHVGFVVDKVTGAGFLQIRKVSLAYSLSTNFSTLIICYPGHVK
jgi:hypothetical protein